MNAYELADQLDNVKYQNGAKPFEMYANMLRQQADRIAELEKQGEAVAWWTGKYEDEGEDFMFPNTRQAHIDHPQSETHKFFSIPLYTTPQTKPLSNDEIREIGEDCELKNNGILNWIDFARAILRKAQEK